MARKVFFSFHFANDHWRAAQVRNMGVVDGDPPVSDNDWEVVKRGGDAAIEKWIDGQLAGKSCTVVLVGSETASRKWVKREIEKSWNKERGVVGIRIHGLKNSLGNTAIRGANPFDGFTLKNGTVRLADVVRLYEPMGNDSKALYENIKTNIDGLVEEAITVRAKY